MDFEKIKELIQIIDSSDLAFFELETGNDRIKMDKSLTRGLGENRLSTSSEKVEKIENITKVKEEVKSVKEQSTEKIGEDDNGTIITSPMVGTFYSSASPESEAFVKVGEAISKGKVICIIEAMKLMNEIESEYSGVITKCLVNNGDMVEYGQPLFKIKED